MIRLIHFLQHHAFLAALTVVAMTVCPAAVPADFSYSYGHPSTPLDDGYIVSTSNASLYSEGNVRTWTPDFGGTTFANTTPGEVIYHFNFDGPSTDMSLWMSMPTFHWSYSQGHNFLFGSTDGLSWEPLAEVQPPSFGGANNLGAVNVPGSLLGSTDLWLRVLLYSYGPSAPSGGVWTNTSQLSRFDVSSPGTVFSLNVSTVPEPGVATLLLGLGLSLTVRRRR